MTEHLFILGHPVAHSKSPAMYNALYSQMGLDWEYGFMDCPDADSASAFLADTGWLSINVTTPYKTLAAGILDIAAASVKISGGANMIVRHKDRTLGLNTDGTGAVAAIERAGASFSGAKVSVCGTGPTSRSMVLAAAQAGAERVLMVGRDTRRSEAALVKMTDTMHELAHATVDLPAADDAHRSLRAATEECRYLFGSYTTSTEAIADSDIIMDATPLGMNDGDPAPFDTTLLDADMFVFDAVYAHGRTALLAAADHLGAACMDGRDMLVAQAVENATALLEIEGIDGIPDRDVMFACMRSAADFA